jgi:chorismate dehydratase
LIIGDRALQFRDRFTYRYDLATAWREMTGLPFVFAVWVSLHVFSQNLIDAFNSAQAKGTYDLDLVVKERKQVFPFFNISNYYKNHISYFLDEQKRKGMQNFLDLIHENKLFLDGQFINIVT